MRRVESENQAIMRRIQRKYFPNSLEKVLNNQSRNRRMPPGYEIYDLNGDLTHEIKAAAVSATTDTRGGGALNDLHIENFLDVVRGESSDQHSTVEDGHKSTLMCQLASMAYRTGETLKCDTSNGKPFNEAAAKLWSREYEAGWEPGM